jgi:hypothetical protein
VAVVAAGAALRFWGLDYGLPHPWARPDEEVVVAKMLGFDAGDPDPRWSVYPTLYLYATYAWLKGVLVTAHAVGAVASTHLATLMADDPRALMLAARALSAVLGTAAIAAAYALGRAVADRRVGLVAAALVAGSFLHVRESHFVKPDAALACMVTLALLAAVRLQRTGSARAALAAGAAAGLVFGVKYDLVIGAAVLVAVLLGPDVATAGVTRVRRTLLAAAAGAAVAVAGSPFLAFDPARLVGWWRLMRFWFSLGGEGVGTGFAYHLENSFLQAQGAPLTLFLAVALVWQGCRRALLPVTAFIVLGLVQLGLSSGAYTRYVTAFVPACAVLAAAAVVALAARLPATVRPAAATAVVAALLAHPLAGAVAFDRIAVRRDTRLLARDWLETHVPQRAAILVLGSRWPYTFGEPVLTGYTVRRSIDLEPKRDYRYVVTHEHLIPFSRLPDGWEALRTRLRPVATFAPTADGSLPTGASFEQRDAFYLPFAGFAHVERGGPVITVWEVS